MREINHIAELLTEPQLISLDMDDPATNTQLAKELFEDVTEKLWETATHIMFRTISGEDGCFSLYNKTTRQLDYVVNAVPQHSEFTGDFVTQTAVWRNTDIPATVGLSKKIFFNYILKMRGIVVCHNRQTVDGQRFWLLRMTEADERGLMVGVLDVHSGIIGWCPTGEIDTWMPDQMHYWSIAARSADFRFIIAEPGIIKKNLGK